MITLQCCLQVLFSILNNYYNIKGLINSKDVVEPNQILMNSRFIPDSISFLVYFSLYWQFLILLYFTHIQHGDILQQNICPPAQPRAIKIFLLLIGIYLVLDATIILTFNLRNQNTKNFTQQMEQLDVTYLSLNVVINFLNPVILFISETVIFFKFSGKLFKSTKDQNSFNYFHRVLVFCCIGRVIQAVGSILIIVYYDDIRTFILG